MGEQRVADIIEFPTAGRCHPRADSPGSGKTGSGKTGSGKTGSGKTGSGKTGSGKTGSGKTGSGKTGSGKTGSGKTGSGKTGALRRGIDRLTDAAAALRRSRIGLERQHDVLGTVKGQLEAQALQSQ